MVDNQAVNSDHFGSNYSVKDISLDMKMSHEGCNPLGKIRTWTQWARAIISHFTVIFNHWLVLSRHYQRLKPVFVWWMRKVIPLEPPLSCPDVFTKLDIIDVNWEQVDLIMPLCTVLCGKKKNLGLLKLQMESNLEPKINISYKELDILLKHLYITISVPAEYYFLRPRFWPETLIQFVWKMSHCYFLP